MEVITLKLNLSREQVLTTENLKKILELFKPDLARMTKLEDYYHGNNDIRFKQNADKSKPCNKLSHPFGGYISDTLCGYFVGEPITYSSTDEEALEALQMTLVYNDAAAADMENARNASIYGVSYEMLYVDEMGSIRFAPIDPKDVIIIYDDTVEENILYAIRRIAAYDIESNKDFYRLEVYDSEKVTYYKTNDSLTSIDYVDETQHFFGDVPFVEYKNNKSMRGDFESILSLIDAYDELESASLDDYDYFVDAYLVLKGVNADSDDIAAMKENRVLLLDEDSSAEWLIKNAQDSVTENMKSRLQQDIHKFAKVPDLSDENFAANASGIAIKFKLYGTETLISNKERYFQKGLQRRIELIYNILSITAASYDWRAIEIHFTRNMPSNDTEIADVVNKLAGIVSNETLLAQIPFVSDVQSEMERIEADREKNPFYNLDLELDKDNTEDE